MIRECMFCGTALEESERYTCSECDRKMSLLKQLKRLDNATEKIEKSAMYKLRKRGIDYKDEQYRVAKKIIESGIKFNSTEEACIALQLEKENIKYIPNFKIGNYNVDFLLPDKRIILEVDGSLYHQNSEKDFIRERAIMRIVGEDYEIVRIDADVVPDYIVLNISESIKHVIFQRNTSGHFRDTRFDTGYFGEYLNLISFAKRI